MRRLCPLRRGKEYYQELAIAQRGDVNITRGSVGSWIAWAVRSTLHARLWPPVLHKAQLWQRINSKPVHPRQRLVINRLLDDFQGFLTTSKYAKLAKCSPDTALRDMRELLSRGILLQNPSGGRSTSYRLAEPDNITRVIVRTPHAPRGAGRSLPGDSTRSAGIPWRSTAMHSGRPRVRVRSRHHDTHHSSTTRMAGHPAPAAGPGALAVRLHGSRPAEAGTAFRHGRPGRGAGQPPGQVPAAAPDALVEVRPGFWRDDFGVVWNRTIDKDIGTVVDYQLQEPLVGGLSSFPIRTIRGGMPTCRRSWPPMPTASAT